MTLYDYRINISNLNNKNKSVYPEDKLKEAIKKLEKNINKYSELRDDLITIGRGEVLRLINEILGKELCEESEENRLCPYCNGLIRIRNPTGKCDHLYYPDNVNKELSPGVEE